MRSTSQRASPTANSNASFQTGSSVRARTCASRRAEGSKAYSGDRYAPGVKRRARAAATDCSYSEHVFGAAPLAHSPLRRSSAVPCAKLGVAATATDTPVLVEPYECSFLSSLSLRVVSLGGAGPHRRAALLGRGRRVVARGARIHRAREREHAVPARGRVRACVHT